MTRRAQPCSGSQPTSVRSPMPAPPSETMARLFISQTRLDAWTAEERIDVQGDVMTLSADGRSFAIRPAVLFTRVAGTDDDPHGLLGTVLDQQALADLGADHYMSSVIIGETAYDVTDGFLGDPMPPGTRRS